MVKLGCNATESDCALNGLTEFGLDLGGFLTNLTPGIVGIVFVLAIVGAVIGLIGAIIFVIKKAINNKM